VRPQFAVAAVSVLLVALLAGCGAHSQQKRREGYAEFYRGRFDEALHDIEEGRDDKSRLLYALDRGMIAHVRGEVEESNRALAEAEAIMEQQFAVDVSDQAASFLVNDYQLEYKGEDFEKVLVHPIKALNYLALGEKSEALVECRAVNERLVALQEKYEQKSVYHRDPFARYLSGIIYESEGNLNDALVDYRLAVEGYAEHEAAYGTAAPPDLIESVLRVAEANGVTGVFQDFRKEHPDATWMPYRERRAQAEIVLVLENGQAPYKVAGTVHLPFDDEWITLSFPTFKTVPVTVSHAVLRADGRAGRTVLAENVAAIAVKDLDDRYHRVVAKELARAALKQVEVNKVKKKNWFLGTALNVVNSANEQADLRSWELLPAQFQIVRLLVEPGFHDHVQLDLVGTVGAVLETVDLGPVELEAGESRFLYYRTLY
jgi:hypothetical protein